MAAASAALLVTAGMADMEDDIKALREEIAKLRERVAVLEAKPGWQYNPMQPSLLERYRIADPARSITGTIPPDAITC